MRVLGSCILLAAAALAVACQSPPQQAVQAQGASNPTAYAGGRGTSTEDAVIIVATDHMAGIRAEYTWLAQQYPGYRRVSQALLRGNGKFYDRIEIETKDGQKKAVYFDITALVPKQ